LKRTTVGTVRIFASWKKLTGLYVKERLPRTRKLEKRIQMGRIERNGSQRGAKMGL